MWQWSGKRHYVCTVYYLPILHLIYTCILYFFTTVLHFNQKYIWSSILFYTCFVCMSLLAWQWTFYKISRLLVFLESARSTVYCGV